MKKTSKPSLSIILKDGQWRIKGYANSKDMLKASELCMDKAKHLAEESGYRITSHNEIAITMLIGLIQRELDKGLSVVQVAEALSSINLTQSSSEATKLAADSVVDNLKRLKNLDNENFFHV